MNKERLLNVAKALRESPNPDKFTMDVYGHSCGTPACALGHYAARRDLQSNFTLNGKWLGFKTEDGLEFEVGHFNPGVLAHFDITTDEAAELFDAEGGCGLATTALEAAEYIEQFVASKE